MHLSDAAGSVPQKVEPVLPLAGTSSIHNVVQQVIHCHLEHTGRSQFTRQRHVLHHRHTYIHIIYKYMPYIIASTGSDPLQELTNQNTTVFTN